MGSGVDAGWVGAGRPGPGRWMHPARRQGRKTLLGLRGEQGFVTTARIRRPFPVSARHADRRPTNRSSSRGSCPDPVLQQALSSDDIRGADAERLGYVNRALPDAELDDFVDALATRIASFDMWAIANTKRLVNEASLPPDVEIRAGWDACMASVKRPAAQERIKTLLAQGFQKPGDSENRLGFYVGQLGLNGER